MSTLKALSSFSDTELGAELERRKKAASAHLPMIGNFNWDQLLDLLDYNAKQSIKNGFEDEDLPHYIYEKVMTTVYGPDYFNWRSRQAWSH